MPGVVATRGKPTLAKCGGWTGCEEDHVFFAPEDVIVLEEAQMLGEMCEEHTNPKAIEKAVGEGTLVYDEDKQAVIPTILGMWLEDCTVN
jgi:hypothetical protein